jgi:Ca2+-transporting ATPase
VDGAPEAPWWRLLLGQFRSLVVLLLLAAAAVAAGLGDTVEALAIGAALGLNAAIGFLTEWRAQASLARLRALVAPRALVHRGGRPRWVAAADLVPGDLVLLEAGVQVPADLRLVRTGALRVTEAALTGESLPVDKNAAAVLALETPLAERRTMAYLGTAVVAGSGAGLVVATGGGTELGRIGALVGAVGARATPLERQVEVLGRQLLTLALAVSAVVGLAGILHGEPLGLMLETAISLAVAAIPEGLPAVTTVALAAGLWRLARAGALVRRLPAVEALGATTVICADKTGTMTENRMVVTHVVADGRTLRLEPRDGAPGRTLVEDGRPVALEREPGVARLLEAAALATDVRVAAGREGVRLDGDPTETALVAALLDVGRDPVALAEAWPRRGEVPFDPGTRWMATFHTAPGGGRVAFVKGAPAVILGAATRLETAAGPAPLDEAGRARARAANAALAAEGLRVLAVGWRPAGPGDGTPGGDAPGRGSESGPGALVFLGLIGLEDPLRPSAREAIALCAEAGIRAVMLTGDQRATAEAVGRRLGLGADAIRSRVTPEDKLRLVERLQAEGEIVAMTGDGVNDAPALARADVGVAMGRQGTDVARDAADIVLTDDELGTIVRAVEEGRVIGANLRKVVRFLFTCNVSEILVILAAILLGLPPPLLPLQILWVNLVTDILPAMALVRDPAEPDVMRRPPRPPREALLAWRASGRLLAEAALLAAGVLSVSVPVAWTDGPGPRSGTLAFAALVLIHPLQALHCRSRQHPWWRLPRNPLVWLSLAALVAAQWLAVAWPPLAGLLRTAPLSLLDWGLVALGVAWPVAVLEGAKLAPRLLSPEVNPHSPGEAR